MSEKQMAYNNMLQDCLLFLRAEICSMSNFMFFDIINGRLRQKINICRLTLEMIHGIPILMKTEEITRADIWFINNDLYDFIIKCYNGGRHFDSGVECLRKLAEISVTSSNYTIDAKVEKLLKHGI